MPMIARGIGEFHKLRLLISGLSQSGKTYNLRSFIYGNYDYWDEREEEKAVAYASGKKMIIISCPNEVGYRSLPEDTPHISSYYFENDSEKDMRSVAWCTETLKEFEACYREAEAKRPDVLVIDGAHALYETKFNIITSGDYLNGRDLKVDSATGRRDNYRAAALYSQAHVAFGNYIAMFYNSPIKTLVVTTWEDWQTARTGDEKSADIGDERFLWPALPGAMATKIVGRFDARLSARLEKRCLHSTCEHSKKMQLHHVWQFYPYGDVMGVGIKGLQMTDAYKQKPWIHQSWAALQQLLQRAR